MENLSKVILRKLIEAMKTKKMSAVGSKWPSLPVGTFLSISFWYAKVLHGLSNGEFDSIGLESFIHSCRVRAKAIGILLLHNTNRRVLYRDLF